MVFFGFHNVIPVYIRSNKYSGHSFLAVFWLIPCRKGWWVGVWGPKWWQASVCRNWLETEIRGVYLFVGLWLKIASAVLYCQQGPFQECTSIRRHFYAVIPKVCMAIV